jgi:predicted Zn finger-like uncharacterized protein
MIVKCEQCKTRFRLADEKIPPSGARVRCARCRHVFRVHRMSALHAQQPHVPSSFVQPPVEDDPFAFFGEPTQTGTSEPTRPGIFLPGVEASRRTEEGKVSMSPPRVPVFGGSGGANISKLFAEKMAVQEETAQLEASDFDMHSSHADETFSEVAGLNNTLRGDTIDTIRVEYLAAEQTHGDAEPAAAGTQKVPSFSIPASLREPLSREHEKGRLEEALSMEEAAMDLGGRVAVQEFSAEEFFVPSSSPTLEPPAQEAAGGGALASLLSAASEDIGQDENASELRRANESEIRRAFVQSKTKVKRRKRWRRVLKWSALLLFAAVILSGVVIYWKEGQVLHRKSTGQIDWGKTFSWERLKKNLFSEVLEKNLLEKELPSKDFSGLHSQHVHGEAVHALKPMSKSG